MFHPNNEVVRYLTRDQYDALLEAAGEGPTYLRPLIVLAVHTALRRGNLLRLRWSQVDLKAKVIRVPDLTKGKRTLEVPINDAAKSALEVMRTFAQMGSNYVFAADDSHISDVKTPFGTALRRAREQLINAGQADAAEGLKGFRFHDLRHTAASWLAMGGAGLPAIQSFLGHASIKMTLRYAHLSPDFLGAEAKILDRMLPANRATRGTSPEVEKVAAAHDHPAGELHK
jgi:integrase